MTSRVDPLRVRVLVDQTPDPTADYVLYWMTAQRRTRFNPALQQAVAHARELGLPLLVLEGLQVDHPWASGRLHRFILDGMADNRQHLDAAGVGYLPYVEARSGEGKGLLQALARRAALVVADEWPCLHLPQLLEAAAAQVACRLEVVDGCGVLPLQASGKAWSRAVDFRRHIQRSIVPHLEAMPLADPLAGLALAPFPGLPEEIRRRWPAAHPGLLDGSRPGALAELDLAGPPPVAERGGEVAGRERLAAFLGGGLTTYGESRRDMEGDPTSGLSPWLHFGHVSAFEVVEAVLQQEDWDLDRLAPKARGSRSGWWGLSPGAEAFLDQIITWRELGFAFAWHRRADMARYEGLPEWALRSLEAHRADPRPYVYDLETFDAAATHDEIWNAAQTQLKVEGRMHNYLRMLWGKKVLHWSESPEVAFRILVELNNRYALDGRDPNSYSGIAWVFGRFDRAWGPERPVFGKIRYMTSASTRRKLRLDAYLQRYHPHGPAALPTDRR